MIDSLLPAMAVSLALTIIIEAGLFWALGKRNRRDLLLLTLVNVLTNPVVVASYWLVVYYTDWGREAAKLILESFAVVTEGLYYRRYGQEFKRPLLFSLAANVLSFGTGIIIQLLL